MKKLLALLFFACSAHAQFSIPLGNSGVRPFARYAILGDHAYFDATGDLWRTDGTTTTRFADFEGDVHDPVTLRGKVAFFVQSELWATDGNTTSLVLAIDATAVDHVMTDGTTLWFTATQNGRVYLWRSDGTPGGTIALAQTSPVAEMRIADELLFFRTYGGDLWRSDGTLTGTFIVRERMSSSTAFRTFRNVALLQHDGDLWRSDGTIEGTYPLRYTGNTDASVFAKTSEAAYFSQYNTFIRTDGTIEGTTRLDGVVQNLAVLDDRLYAIDYEGISILAGTKLVRVLAASQLSPYWTVSVGDAIWFSGFGTGLWRFDGTSAKLVHPSGGSFIGGLTAFGEQTLYFAEDDVRGREPWITDGTAAGTHMLANTMPEGRIEGRVVDAHGNPIAYTTLTLYTRQEPGQPSWSNHRELWQSAGAGGRYVFDGLRDGTYYLRAGAHGHMTVWWRDRECDTCALEMTTPIVVQNGEAKPDHDFVLRARGLVRGRVLDDQARPIPSAPVRVACGNSHNGTYTDLQGFYTMQVPPDRDCVVSTSHKSYANASLPVRVASGGSQAADFVLTPNGAISGRLIDAVTNEALTIYAIVTARHVVTKEVVRGTLVEGGYAITLPDGQWEITIAPQEGGYPAFTFPDVVSATPGRTTPGYDVTLMPVGARIGGRVIDAASGAPLGGTAIRVMRGDTLVASLFTNADGTYVTRPDLTPGTYVVQLEASATRPGQSSHVTVSGLDVAKVDFVLGRYPVLTGTVIDEVTREPLRNVRVGDAVTDAHGRYWMVAVDGVVSASKLGWATASREIDVGAADMQVDFELAPSCSLTPSTTHAIADDKITIPLTGNCTACASTTSPYIRFDRACVKDELTAYVEKGRSGTIALPGMLITVEGR